jgi:hypothetical protein
MSSLMQIEIDDNAFGKRGEDALEARPRRCCP